ncbi:helix-turn-helix transcriptional regulator [Nannocystis sp. ILAH1]|nr:helix-turn-helix transcriptional regulator [Nannocystis sp. ILAH1]MCY1071490.1 helix-turn-helix transcriptional regulator [Nannocystis sp. RBIL2]
MEVSTRYLSFVETGRSLPSRTMLLRLADHLRVPLGERNRNRHCAGCGSNAVAFTLEPIEVCCSACERRRVK